MGAEETVSSNQALIDELLKQTSGLRDLTTEQLTAILGGAPASSVPAYAPSRAALENQYNVAQGQILSTLPRGGQQNAALEDLINTRASGVSNLESTIAGNAFNQALSTGFGVLPVALGTEAQSANTLASLENQQAQSESQNILMSAAGIGALLDILFGQKGIFGG